MTYKTINNINWAGKRGVVRVDFNVPMNSDGTVRELMRVKATIPTLQYILANGGSLILLTHLGRPKGKRCPEFSTELLIPLIEKLLLRPVIFVSDLLSDEAAEVCGNLQPGQVVLMENVRFYPEEEANDDNFAKTLASYGDVFVNDAFSTNHRSHASVVGIPKYLPACAGLLLQNEIVALDHVLKDPEKPLVAIIGGSKVSDKMKILGNLLPIVDRLLIGGGMANTFLAALGFNMEKSLVEEDRLELAYNLIHGEYGDKILLPVDVVAAGEFSADADHKAVSVNEIPQGYMALDIGPETADLFRAAISDAKTVLWNGPMGVFEMEPYAAGTKSVAVALGEIEAYSIIGGGDSAAAIKSLGLEDTVDHICTGGGASLKYLEGTSLPGIASLEPKKKIIAGNWKMNCTLSETLGLIAHVVNDLPENDDEVIIFPSFVSLTVAKTAIGSSKIALGAQNVYFEPKGAYTGEVSIDMLKEAGVTHVIVGHSERRQYFGEDGEMLNKKVVALLEAGLIPVYCIGETGEEKESGKTAEVLRKELNEGFQGVSVDNQQIILAYEPIWAIGTGKTPTCEEADATMGVIRDILKEMNLPADLPILYGGSANPGNAKDLLLMSNCDGLLIGGASLKADSFLAMVNWRNQ